MSREAVIQSALAETRDWELDRGGNGGSFKVINHLGLSDFSIEFGNREVLDLTRIHLKEIRSIKNTEDWLKMTLSFQQLLLNWNAPTRLRLM